MLVVEFRVDSPILGDALDQAPGVKVSHEEQYLTDGDIVMMFWAAGEDLDGFEDALAADPTVSDPVELARTDGRRLYRVTFTERGESAATFPSWSEFDISLLDSTATADGWEVRMRMPDRDSLRQYRDLCEEQDLGFELVSVYERSEAPDVTSGGLTMDQREALVTARRLGHFEIPQQATLADVADQLGVSSQAVSERLRRGIATLVDETFLTDEE